MAPALTEEEKEKRVLDEIKKEVRSKRGYASGSDVWVSAKVGTYEETHKIYDVLLKKGLIVESAPGIYKLPGAAPTTIEPKFKIGDKVRYRVGESFTIEAMNFDKNTNSWQYTLQTQPYLIAPHEKELADYQVRWATEHQKGPAPQYKKGDIIIYHQGLPNEAIYTIKTAEFNRLLNQWTYAMETPADANRRFTEAELVLAPSRTEAQMIEQQAAAEARAAPTFKIGDKVLWKGRVYTIESTEEMDDILRYRFWTDQGYAMAREEDLKPAPPEGVWMKGMPLTDKQILEAEENAVSAIENNYVATSAIAAYDTEGRDAAMQEIKRNLQYWGMGSPDMPDLNGSAKGVWVTNRIFTSKEAEKAPSTDARLLTWGDLLDFILANREKYQPQIAPAAQAKNLMESVRPMVPAAANIAVPLLSSQTATPQVAEAPPPAPKPIRTLNDSERRLLQAYFNTQLIRGLGRLPSGVSSIFLVEYQEVKNMPFEDARAAIIGAADRFIEDLMAAQKARALISRGERIQPPSERASVERAMGRAPSPAAGMPEEGEEGQPGAAPTSTGMVERSTYPPIPLPAPGGQLPLNFPRRPQSQEAQALWEYFCYQLGQKGVNCQNYQRQFEDYITRGPRSFKNPKDLKDSYDFFVKTLLSGQSLPPLGVWGGAYTLPSAVRGELIEYEVPEMQIERLDSIIAFFAATLIVNSRGREKKPTLNDLYNELVERGQIAPTASSREEFNARAKTAIRAAYNKMRSVQANKEKGFPVGLIPIMYLVIPLQELDDFLST